MKAKLSIVLISHLSDVNMETSLIGCVKPEAKSEIQQTIHNRVNFCKHLLNKYSDTSIEIDADDEYTEWYNKKNK